MNSQNNQYPQFASQINYSVNISHDFNSIVNNNNKQRLHTDSDVSPYKQKMKFQQHSPNLKTNNYISNKIPINPKKSEKFKKKDLNNKSDLNLNCSQNKIKKNKILEQNAQNLNKMLEREKSKKGNQQKKQVRSVTAFNLQNYNQNAEKLYQNSHIHNNKKSLKSSSQNNYLKNFYQTNIEAKKNLKSSQNNIKSQSRSITINQSSSNNNNNNINNISKTFMTNGTPSNLRHDKLFNNSYIQNSGKNLGNKSSNKSFIDSGGKQLQQQQQQQKSKSRSKTKKSSKQNILQVYSPTQFKYPKKIKKRNPSGNSSSQPSNLWILNSNQKYKKTLQSSESSHKKSSSKKKKSLQSSTKKLKQQINLIEEDYVKFLLDQQKFEQQKNHQFSTQNSESLQDLALYCENLYGFLNRMQEENNNIKLFDFIKKSIEIPINKLLHDFTEMYQERKLFIDEIQMLKDQNNFLQNKCQSSFRQNSSKQFENNYQLFPNNNQNNNQQLQQQQSSDRITFNNNDSNSQNNLFTLQQQSKTLENTHKESTQNIMLQLQEDNEKLKMALNKYKKKIKDISQVQEYQQKLIFAIRDSGVDIEYIYDKIRTPNPQSERQSQSQSQSSSSSEFQIHAQANPHIEKQQQQNQDQDQEEDQIFSEEQRPQNFKQFTEQQMELLQQQQDLYSDDMDSEYIQQQQQFQKYIQGGGQQQGKDSNSNFYQIQQQQMMQNNDSSVMNNQSSNFYNHSNKNLDIQKYQENDQEIQNDSRANQKYQDEYLQTQYDQSDDIDTLTQQQAAMSLFGSNDQQQYTYEQQKREELEKDRQMDEDFNKLIAGKFDQINDNDDDEELSQNDLIILDLQNNNSSKNNNQKLENSDKENNNDKQDNISSNSANQYSLSQANTDQNKQQSANINNIKELQNNVGVNKNQVEDEDIDKIIDQSDEFDYLPQKEYSNQQQQQQNNLMLLQQQNMFKKDKFKLNLDSISLSQKTHSNLSNNNNLSNLNLQKIQQLQPGNNDQNNNNNKILSYQEEFMSKQDEFSESWRNQLMEQEKRFNTQQ